MRSMTGYGQAVGEQDGLRVAVTARSVNHRYLDLALRLRDDHPDTERKVRERVAERLERGRRRPGQSRWKRLAEVPPRRASTRLCWGQCRSWWAIWPTAVCSPGR